jgi:AcrR family transcriptional regulator
MKTGPAEDWVTVALQLLRDEGQVALTLDRLCQQSGKTKGSFYHHYESLDALAAAMLERWREQHTLGLIRHTTTTTPRERRAALSRLVQVIDARLELAVRAWALWDGRAGEAVRRVDAERVAFLESLWVGLGVTRGARALARLEYVAFLGALQAFPSLQDVGAVEVNRAFERLLQQARASARRQPEGARRRGRAASHR